MNMITLFAFFFIPSESRLLFGICKGEFIVTSFKHYFLQIMMEKWKDYHVMVYPPRLVLNLKIYWPLPLGPLVSLQWDFLSNHVYTFPELQSLSKSQYLFKCGSFTSPRYDF